MTAAMPDPRALPAQPFAPAARRTLAVHGGEGELVLLPGRVQRPDRPDAGRPAFRAPAAARILAEETAWRGEVLAITKNRYPFAAQQLIAWSARPSREPDAAFLDGWLGLVARLTGSGLLNSIGAAASIAHAHAHATPERLPFLPALRTRPFAAAWLPAVDGAEYACADVPFCLLAVKGPQPARAAALQALQLCRMTAAVNVVAQDEVAWVFPRRTETPAPHFPYALGAAEVWGRWCYAEREPFERATSADLERALALAGCAPL